jgi:PIF1-like helicase/Helitron helicase-like domain at N-terminus
LTFYLLLGQQIAEGNPVRLPVASPIPPPAALPVAPPTAPPAPAAPPAAPPAVPPVAHPPPQIPLGCQEYHEPEHRHSLGPMNITCVHCQALHFRSEKLTNSSNVNPRFGMCCLQGQVQLPPFSQPPLTLTQLLMGSSHLHKKFRDNIRQYNAAFAFTSIAAKVNDNVLAGSGPYAFRLHGSLHHRMGALLPNDGNQPRYAQLYVLDPDDAVNARLANNPNLDPSTMNDLHDMLAANNPYINMYKHAHEILRDKPPEEQVNVAVRIVVEPNTDLRRYNAPTVKEVAAIIPGGGEESVSLHRDIIVRLHGGNLKRISQLHHSYSPLHYVLLFPKGDSGYYIGIPSQPGQNGQVRSKDVSQQCYYAYHAFPRLIGPDTIFRGGKLFQQYLVDAWVSTEESKLHWVRTNQKKIRADLYQGLHDAVHGNQDGAPVNLGQQGQRIVLPSSHLGSSRHMYQLFQDSMAICRYGRKPDIFLTMTANPNWPEIQDALLHYEDGTCQTASDRPDIVARIFNLKKKALLDEIRGGLFGELAGNVYTIEFQKRGLPHIHLLIFLKGPYKIRDAAHVDSIVSAQLPDPDVHPLLYDTVTKLMVHGPCGAPDHISSACMVKDANQQYRCSKHYPRDFCEETHFGEDGYPRYARPDNGRTFTKIIHGSVHTFTNRDVVPHNPYLLAKYDCHINVEISASVKAVKYIHKYVYKGHDRATVQIGNVDEIQDYIDARYIGPVEACWRIFEFSMHQELPSVYRLPVHLQDEQTVYFQANDNPQDVLDRPSAKKTQLTEWFKANQDFPAIAHLYLYQDFPQHFVWEAKGHHWKKRQQGFAIGRMYFVHPSAGERFYLRMLLTIIKGATDWKDLRTYNGVEHPTYKAACFARGLLEDDGEWDQCMQEAGDMQTGSQLRSLFASILRHNNPSQPAALWDHHKAKLCDDLHHTLTHLNHPDPTEEQIFDYGLYLIDCILSKMGKRLSDFPPMPLPQHQWQALGNLLLQEELDYDVYDLTLDVEVRYASFNEEQKLAYDAVMASVDGDQGKSFFLHSAGGGGKTYVCNTIAAAVRSKGKVALCVASSGIASLLLDGGRTAHSRFKIPISLHETSTCNLKQNPHHEALLRETSVIIWDEAPMQHRYAMEALDRTLRDLLQNDSPFAGITVLFGGDFRQILPVIPKGLRQQIVSASICRSYLWQDITLLHLKQNMRLDRTPQSDAFAQWLLEVGAGRHTGPNSSITLPANMRLPDNTVEGLISTIYPNITNAEGKPDQYFLDRTILSTKNDAVDDLNSAVLNLFPGVESTLISIDKAKGNQEDYPIEYLNSLNVSGLPLAHLCVRVGCPLMLLRNLDPSHGLCNGTRLILLEVKPRVLKCRILGGKHAGRVVFIPRITLEPSEEQLPIPLSRRQFPVRVAFSMTINKSQGQSVTHVGLDLRSSVFTHGQLYVALSRCTSGDRIKALFPEGSETTSTMNVVYPEILVGVLPTPW